MTSKQKKMFRTSLLPYLKISSARFFCSVIFNHLNRSFFSKVSCQMLGRIFSAAEIHDSTSKNINTIFPDISFGALGIHIATNRRMVILPSELLPHNVYNQNVISEAATILAISGPLLRKCLIYI